MFLIHVSGKEMENKCREKNIFESGFDSFELDDEFFNRLDFDVKKNNANEKLSDSKGKASDGKREKSKKTKAQCYDSLFIDDSNDSDFFDFRCKEKKQSSKVQSNSEKKGSNELSSSGFISFLSPILGEKASKSVNKRLNLSSSTPERPNNELDLKEKVKPRENSHRNSDYAYLEDVVFDDWDMDGSKKKDGEKDTVTLSQALKLLDKAESESRSDQESSNESIDLLTGEVVNANLEKIFEESFGLPESTKKMIVKESSDESVIVEGVKSVSKPSAAQKLNFESEKITPAESEVDKGSLKDFCFSSDEDFVFCSPDLLKQAKQVTKSAKGKASGPKFQGNDKDSDPDESSDVVNTTFQKKRRKCFKVIESDTAEDSPSPKFLRQNKMVSKRRRKSRGNIGREFIDLEAELSDSFEVSSDEAEEDGEFDRSFVDEASYLTQNCAANMTAKYLESVKSVNCPGTFKIPASKPYSPINVFSQIPEESNSDYEIDSFCIKDVEEEEEEAKSDLSVLEIAERILEMERKERKKKHNQRLRKL